MKRDCVKNIGFFLLIFALANILVYSLTFQEAYTSLIAPLIFIVLAALAVMLSPFSVVPFSIIAISIWGKGVTLLYVMIGSL